MGADLRWHPTGTLSNIPHCIFQRFKAGARGIGENQGLGKKELQ
jgi:hypothetical protein